MRPSAIFREILRRLLGADQQDALGDLDEELARGGAGRTRGVRAEVWYVREATSLLLAVVAAKLRDARERRREERTMGGLARDVRQAFRGLLREPGPALAVVVTLAVAIGATTAIFAVADAAFLRPLSYPHAERLVRIYSGSRDDPNVAFSLSPLDVRDIGAFDTLVEDLGVWSVGETVHLTDAEEPLRLEAPRASAGLFRVLGVQPELGRFFLDDEELPGGDDAVVLSNALWTSAFGADPAVVGSSVRLDGRSVRVVGVAPAQGMLPREADLWRALALGPEWYDPGRWGWQFLNGVARLRPGADPLGAQEALTRRLAESVPERVERGQTRVVRTLREERVGDGGRAIVLLLVAVGLVLAMACVNVMNVMLARSERKARELGLRRALGSGVRPLARGVVIETALLGLLGCAAGLLVAHVALAAMSAADLEATARLGLLRVDPRVVAFAVLVTGVTGVLFGGAPVQRALRADPQAILREGGSRSGSSRRARRMRDGLVVAQVSMACTLLAAVGLSTSAFIRLVERDPGFRAQGVLTMGIELPANEYGGVAASDFYRSLLDGLGELPGVASAGAVQFLPLTGVGWSASVDVLDPDPSVDDPDPGGNLRPVAPGYFETMGIPVLEGRTFTDADGPEAAPVVIVDETLARRYWPGISPVGRQLGVGALSREAATIVGVVGSVPDESLSRPGRGHVYFPLLQRAMRSMVLVIRASGDPAALAPAVRAAVRQADPRIPITEVSTLEAAIGRSVAGPRVALMLLVAFGVAAVVLAAVGIYGVLAYTVARRTGEIGTRMALGASPRTVLASVLASAMRLWLWGAALGAGGAAAVGGTLSRLVQGVSVTEPVPYVAAFAGLAGVALLAALLPALRATTVDPTRALRAE